MKLGLHFREALEGVSPWIVAELDQMTEAIRTSYLLEHDADGRSRQIYVQAVPLAAQTLATGTSTRLLVGKPAVLVGAIGLDTASGIVTIREPGLYTVIGQVRYAANATGARVADLYSGLSRVAVSLLAAAGGGNITIPQAVAVVPCVRGTTLWLSGFQNSGGNLDVEVADTFLSVSRVG